MPRPSAGERNVRAIARSIALVASVSAIAVSIVPSVPASATGYTGGLSPLVLGGRLDMNGSGGIGGRDDSSGFYGQTDVIDGAIDCDAWNGPNAGLPGDGVIDASDDCVLVGVDGTVEGATIVVGDGSIATVDGVPVADGYQMPALFNASFPSDPQVADADFGWWVFDGHVDANSSGSIDDADCSRGVVGETDDVGLGPPGDGADVLAASPACANALTVTSAEDGLVDLDDDGQLTAADWCDDGCFLGHGIAAGLVAATAVGGPVISSVSPTSGPVGSTVTVEGSSLAGALEVRFNGVLASIVSNTDTEIVAIVPAGATTGPISVVTTAGSAVSTTTFAVTVPPPGLHTRAVTITLRRHLAAAGAVTVADGTTACAVGVDVRIQRKVGHRWRTIQAAQTRRNMTYVAILPDLPGVYRAFLPNGTLADGGRCASARSSVVRR
jgi:hypothetical protein